MTNKWCALLIMILFMVNQPQMVKSEYELLTGQYVMDYTIGDGSLHNYWIDGELYGWLNLTAALSNIGEDRIYFTPPYIANTYCGLHYNGSNLAYYCTFTSQSASLPLRFYDYVVYDTYSFNENITISMSFNGTHTSIYADNSFIKTISYGQPPDYVTKFTVAYDHQNLSNVWVFDYTYMPRDIQTTSSTTQTETETITAVESTTITKIETDVVATTNTDSIVETDYTTITDTTVDRTIDTKTIVETSRVTEVTKTKVTETDYTITIEKERSVVDIGLNSFLVMLIVFNVVAVYRIKKPKQIKAISKTKACGACGYINEGLAVWCMECGIKI